MTILNMEITASESPQTVHIPLEGKYYAIKNTGDHDVLVSSYVTNPTEGADDVMKILSGSAAVIPVKDGDLYVSAEEDGTYSVSIQDDKVIPWGGGTGSGGGSGGDNTHYKGTTTTPLANGSTTNPIVIDGETYTAVFGDVVVYGYTEFVFDGTAWSEFGRPFDTTPTQGSTNAVTSDGIYKRTPFTRGTGNGSAVLGNSTASGEHATAIGSASQATQRDTFAAGNYARALGTYSSVFGFNTIAQGDFSHVVGRNNNYKSGDLFEVGNGPTVKSLSNILEVNATSANVNGDIKINNVAIPTPYTTMPTITADMLGKIAMYVGATGGGYTQGCFYIAATDGAAEPTYSWVRIGGGRTETVLYSANAPHKTDVELSQPYTNFDEIVIIWKYSDISSRSDYAVRYETTKLTSQMNADDEIVMWEGDILSNAYRVEDSTHLNFTMSVATLYSYLAKVIGIKY